MNFIILLSDWFSWDMFLVKSTESHKLNSLKKLPMLILAFQVQVMRYPDQAILQNNYFWLHKLFQRWPSNLTKICDLNKYNQVSIKLYMIEELVAFVSKSKERLLHIQKSFRIWNKYQLSFQVSQDSLDPFLTFNQVFQGIVNNLH